MSINEIFISKNNSQRLYCGGCKGWLDLAFVDFKEEVSGVWIDITGLPMLHCPTCDRHYFTERSRLSVIETHRQAMQKQAPAVHQIRCKLTERYEFTNVPFLYDPDDYRHFPGLERGFEVGFLTPVFFNRSVLLKYDTASRYRVEFASTTHGKIASDDGRPISFGINRHGKILMWLGDIAMLPETEQHYLRSENVASDHFIGSEFYDEQIECIFQPSQESRLFALRSDFVVACHRRYGVKIAHLDDEVITLALALKAPVEDTPKERRRIAEALNKIYIESLDIETLASLLKEAGGDPKDWGSLTSLQALLETDGAGADISSILSPFFVLYDLRVAYLHLIPRTYAAEALKIITERLGIDPASGLIEIYHYLMHSLATSYETLVMILRRPKDQS